MQERRHPDVESCLLRGVTLANVDPGAIPEWGVLRTTKMWRPCPSWWRVDRVRMARLKWRRQPVLEQTCALDVEDGSEEQVALLMVC